MDYRLVINYDGQWDDLRYVGGDTFVEVVSIHLKYLELENLVYQFTNFDRTLYDVIITSLVKTESGQRKYRLQRETDVRFLLLGQTVVLEVYVDLVEKVARDVRDQPAVPPRRSQIPIGVPVAHFPPHLQLSRILLPNNLDLDRSPEDDSDLDGQDDADTNTEWQNQGQNQWQYGA
ncbi:hypothetical protein QYF36_014188 [Acer negundo]|nr:hypothetical protein QYF36_014188 [Acer negundo]